MKILRAVGSTFIVIGLTLLLFVVYELYGTSLITNRHQSALAAEFDDSIEKPAPRVDEPPEELTRRTDGPRPVARLRIPKIKLDKIVVEGTTLYHLKYGPGHYTKTDDIGHAGTAGIAGHRTTYGAPFINLDKLHRGDEIHLETLDGSYTYSVTRSVEVAPGETWVLDGDPESRATHQLVLTTCTPKFSRARRLIVFAELDDGAPRQGVGRFRDSGA